MSETNVSEHSQSLKNFEALKSGKIGFFQPKKISGNFLDPEIQGISWFLKSDDL